jgi:hypothetical protein
MYDPPKELFVLPLLFKGTAEGSSSSGGGFFLAGLGTAGSETMLPSLDHGRLITLLEAEWMILLESPQLTTLGFDKMYDGTGEFDPDWVKPRKWPRISPSSSFFPTRFSLEFICIGRCLFLSSLFVVHLLIK